MKKWYMLAIIIVIVSALVLTVSASTGTVQRTLSYNDIKITLDGQEITPPKCGRSFLMWRPVIRKHLT